MFNYLIVPFKDMAWGRFPEICVVSKLYHSTQGFHTFQTVIKVKFLIPLQINLYKLEQKTLF